MREFSGRARRYRLRAFAQPELDPAKGRFAHGVLLAELRRADPTRPALVAQDVAVDAHRSIPRRGPPKDPENAFASRPYRRCDELRIVRAHQRQHLAQREPAVSGPLAQLSKKNATGEAPLGGVELWLRESAAGSAARALRTRAPERPAVGQRLGRSSGRGWPPVLESSPSTGNCMRSMKDHRIRGRHAINVVYSRGICQVFGRIP